MHPIQTVVFSVVSHGQLGIVKDFLSDFQNDPSLANVRLILTLNIPEDETCLREFVALPMTVVRNVVPAGFGANHNRAFAMACADVFVIVNPDIRLHGFSLRPLLELFSDARVGAAAPVVLASSGSVEDSVRRFPTVVSLAKRAIFGRPGPDYSWAEKPIRVDWSAGMFVAFRRNAYAQVGGFDEKFFLYYEDADICRRLAKHGWTTMLQPATAVIHDAQRASRHSRQHLKWHLESIFRFLFLARR